MNIKHLSVLIKPSSGNCNLRCSYCFYHDEMDNREVKSRGFMTKELAETVIKKAFSEEPLSFTAAFQGGEPTLIGLEFFRFFIKKVTEYNVKMIPVNYALQTNGTLLDGEWCRFLNENRFLVGLSLDGDKDIHDMLRDKTKGSFDAVLSSARLLESFNVDFNILTVVTKQAAAHPQKIYNNLKRLGFKYLQFIPCLDPIGGRAKEYSLNAKDYGRFLTVLYGLWLKDYRAGNYISVRLFDNIITRLNGGNAELCTFNGVCSIQFVIEADGSVYPCDFYCLDEFLLGNIKDDSFSGLLASKAAVEFIEKSKEKSEKCLSCNYFSLCKGGCRRETEGELCESYKRLYQEILRD